MIDHITFRVKDLERSKVFYENIFEPLGYKVSFGEEGIFWAFDVGAGCLFEIAQAKEKPTGVHIALRVKHKEVIDRFYDLALKNGAKCNGKPGPRPQYTENYYACFILDPDGHNIEVMYDIY